MKHEFLNLEKLTSRDFEALEMAASRVIRSGRYLHGPETERLEERLCSVSGTSHAVGVSNGLDALRLTVRGYIENGRLRPGDKILYPANTYIASVIPLTEFGLIPVPVEPDETTMNLDFRKALGKIDRSTKGVMVVHLYGTPAWDFEAAAEMRAKGLLIIEDNAQAIGASVTDPETGEQIPTGGLGDAAGLSFYPTKNIGALGDSGAVVTNDAELAGTIRALANYGSRRRYDNIYSGYNCRIDEIQAAMLNVKLSKLDRIGEERNQTAAVYSEKIQNPAVTKPAFLPGTRQVWHQYVIRTPRRDEFREWLRDNGIGSDVHYATPPHLQKCYLGKGWNNEPLPITEKMAAEVVSIPIAGVTPEEAADIAETINGFLR